MTELDETKNKLSAEIYAVLHQFKLNNPDLEARCEVTIGYPDANAANGEGVGFMFFNVKSDD